MSTNPNYVPQPGDPGYDDYVRAQNAARLAGAWQQDLTSGNISQSGANQANQGLLNLGYNAPANSIYSTPDANGGLTTSPYVGTVPPQPAMSNLGAGAQPRAIPGKPAVTARDATATGEGDPQTTTTTAAPPLPANHGIVSSILNGLNNPIAPVIESIGGMAANLVGINQATNALTQGGQQAQQQIQQGATAAENTLGTTLGTATQNEQNIIGQNNQTVANQQGANTSALDPYTAAGAAATQKLSNMQPFSFDPTNLQNDPGYQFRLQQGEQAIQNAASAGGGNSLSGATMKALDQFAGGEASQEFQNAYNRALGTYQENLAVPTQLSNLGEGAAATGVGANTNLAQTGIGANTSVGNIIGQITSNYGNNVAGIQTGTANAIANLQTQIASAVASGDIATANALTSTLSQLSAWAQNNGIVQALKNGQGNGKGNTDTATATGNTVTVNIDPNTGKVTTTGNPGTNTNGNPTNSTTSRPPVTIHPAPYDPSPNPTTLDNPNSTTNATWTNPQTGQTQPVQQDSQTSWTAGNDQIQKNSDGSYTVTNSQSGASYQYPQGTDLQTVINDSESAASGTTSDNSAGDTGAGDLSNTGDDLSGDLRRPGPRMMSLAQTGAAAPTVAAPQAVPASPATATITRALATGGSPDEGVRQFLQEIGAL